MSAENVNAFSRKFEEIVSATIDPYLLIPEFCIDTEINFNDIKNPTFNYNQQTQYTITMTPADGTCPTVDTLLVTLSTQTIQSALDVPNAWSPNGDGHNDRLYPLTIKIKELKYFRVYNRWGQLMFETHTLGQGWDGTFNGQPQVMDVYTWIVEATGEDGVHYKKAGNSILMR